VQTPTDLPALSTMRQWGGALRFRLRALGLEQVLRLLACAVALAVGRLLHPRGGHAWRAWAARRLAATLGALKGPFAKVGQFASTRLDVLPAEVRDGLATLRDRVPPLAPGWVRWMVERELGAPLESLFAAFEAPPLGAASIGQVHRARLPDGTPVAVKVQYPWLAGSLGADLGLLHAGFRVARPARGEARARRDRLFGEFAAGVREELDFRREARVAGEIRANLAHEPQIVVPRVFASHSARRVLTMEYFATLPVTDPRALHERGVSSAEVLEILTRAYAKQIFVDGLFHADPHSGNLFVLDEPDAARRPRVLFVDFGLSKRLAPELRAELRTGIFALLQGRLDDFLAGMRRLDMIAPGAEPGVRRAVDAMFERLRAETGGPLGMGAERVLGLKDEAKRLLEETPGLQLPNDLLLYAKTLSHLFALGRELAPQVDLMKIAVPYLLRFLATAGPGAG
jgi:ubiquinone biosynthesis protein